MSCPLPPPGWECTRDAGHDGPCAAWPVPIPKVDVDWAYDRLSRLTQVMTDEAAYNGPRLLRGHGYPNEVMSSAQDALALQIVLTELVIQKTRGGR